MTGIVTDILHEEGVCFVHAVFVYIYWIDFNKVTVRVRLSELYIYTGCSKTRVQKSFFDFQFYEKADVLKINFQCQIGSPISFVAAYRSNLAF